jgi:alpha-tubulin suppressor-like RCC1 family protein
MQQAARWLRVLLGLVVCLPAVAQAGTIASGNHYTVLVKPDGTVWAWGNNDQGQLGDGTQTNRWRPTQVAGLTDVVAAAVGLDFSLVLTNTGTVWAWGGNSCGQVGDGTTTRRLTPVSLSLTNIVAIAAGGQHALAMQADGTVYVWGRNDFGQLGNGGTTNNPTPTINTSFASASAIGGGFYHTLVVKSDGTVWGAGSNANGQLGVASLTSQLTPVQMGGSLTTAVAAVGGENHSVILLADHTVRAVGLNNHGQLGNASTTTTSTPVTVSGLTSVKEIGAGKWDSGALKTDGSIWTWGYNFDGQVGDGATGDRTTPAHSTTSTGLTFGQTFGFGHFHTIVADDTGVVWGWGYNALGMVGDGTTTTRFTPVAISGPGYAWNMPPVGFAPAPGTYTTAQTVTLTNNSGVAATIRYTTDGTTPTASSTAYTAPFSVAHTTTIIAATFATGYQPTPTTGLYTMNFGTLAAPTLTPGAGNYITSVSVTMSAAAGTTIRYTTDGNTPTTTSAIYTAPVVVTLPATLKAKAFHPDYIASGVTSAAYTLQVAAPTLTPTAGTYAAGQLITISCDTPGADIHYRLDGVDPTQNDPVIASGGQLVMGSVTLTARAWKTGLTVSPVSSATYVVTGNVATAMVSGGWAHSLVLRNDGTVWAWGDDSYTQLGDGTANGRGYAVPVAGLTGVQRVAAGSSHNLALMADGTLQAWGANLNGRIGDGTTTWRSRPVAVPGLTTVVAIAASQHSLALKADGTLAAWGTNGNGQLGDTSTVDKASPVAVSGLTGVTAIAAGASHSLAVKSDGTVWAWGLNGNGQLGDGTTTQRTTPTAVSGLTGIQAVRGGYASSAALATDGHVWAWGNNGLGTLCNGTTNQSTTPVLTTGLSNVTQIAMGTYHLLALESDGTVWGCGLNDSGQIGDGTNVRRYTAVQVPGLTNIVAIGAGDYHSLAIASDGSVWAWGKNYAGTLGDGTSLDRWSPVRVAEANFAWKVGTPFFSLGTGTYMGILGITVWDVTPGATMHYTVTGVDPTEADPIVASGSAVTIDQPETLKVRAWKTGMPPSDIASAVYTLQLSYPVLTPNGGTYQTPIAVMVTSPVPGAEMHYTLTGVDPTQSDPSVASGGSVSLTQTTQVRVKAWKAGWIPATWAQTFTFQVGTITVSPAPGAYTAAQNVTVSTVTPGADLHYTTNGVEPTVTDPFVAGGGTIPVGASATLKIKGFRTGWNVGPTTAAIYTFSLGTVATPVLTPAGGTYATPQTITVSTATPGATIRYTTDGSDPTFQSPIVTGPIAVSVSQTVKAKAFLLDWQFSAIASASYVLADGGVGRPSVTPVGGALAATQYVTVTPAGGTTVHYTTTGVDPTEADAVLPLNGQILIDKPLRLKLRAWVGSSASAVVTHDYRLTGAIAAGAQHTVALKVDGTVWAWGKNDVGQLGDTTTTTRTTPVAVSGLTDVIAITAGGNHTLAIKRDGTVWAWGKNSGGQLGDNSTTNRLAPVQVSGLTDIVGIAAGDQHSLAVTRAGVVKAWGNNGFGQLGDGTNAPHLTPITVPGLSGVSAVAAGLNHSLAIRSDGAATGTLWVWGGDYAWQLGDGTVVNVRSSPFALLSGVALADGGWEHSIVVLGDGTARAWGQNIFGDVGDGTTTTRASAVVVKNLQDIRALASGGRHVLALTGDGTVMSWGHDDLGQVCHTWADSSQSQVEPLGVVGLPAGIVAIAAGDTHSVALAPDGHVWTWGGNASGQLGDGSTTTRTRPVQVSGLSLADESWLTSDPDGDGLSTARELQLGTDPLNPDTNGDGILDGAEVAAGLSATNLDMDGDGVSNAVERAQGTNPFRADTDGDGVADGVDAFPLDPTRWQAPTADPNDHTAPTITLIEPTSAVPIPPL